MRSIVIIATLDTKGDQIGFLKEVIEKRGQKTTIMDVGVLGKPSIPPDIDHQQVAKAAGSTVEQLSTMSGPTDPKPAMDKMAEGASRIIKDLCHEDKVNGVLALGGSMGTALGIDVIKSVPHGIPKIILSTVAHSAAITPDMVGGDDVMLLPWTAGLWGINDISRGVLQTAAGAIAGAAHQYEKKEATGKKIVGATSLGATACRYMAQLKPALESRGYEVAVFHTTGMSGRMYERVISEGLLSASLDLSVGVEFLNQAAGSAFGAGEHRLEAAGKKGIPQIVSTGAIEVLQWGSEKPFPEDIKERFLTWHNTLLAQFLSNPELCAMVGKMMAKQLNKATGPTSVVLPMRSLTPSGEPPPPPDPGQKGPPKSPLPPDFSLQLMTALRNALMQDFKAEINVVELDASFNEPIYSETILKLFDEMMSS